MKIQTVLWCTHQLISWNIKRGGSRDLDFLWLSGESGKGVGGARVCALNHCNIAKWSRVAKCVNILQDINMVSFLT
jgi:hypothetical protein